MMSLSRSLFMALLLCFALPSPQAKAGEVSVLTGAGPRFDASEGSIDAVGVLHLSYEVLPMVLVSGELHGYTGGLGVPDDVALADLQLGVLFKAPIPGWFGVEIGASVGVQNLLEDRHNEDSVVGMLKPEVALTAQVALFKARLAYQHNLLPMGESDMAKLDDGQFTLMAGIVF